MGKAIVGQWGHLGWVAAKAALLFVLAVIGLRLSARRTLAELSVYDFVTAVAVGAVVGRVPNSSSTSFVAGAVTLVVLLGLHRLLGMARMAIGLGRMVDHPPVVLVHSGIMDTDALRRAQLTEGDLASMLRARGVLDLTEVDLVVFEPGGALSTVGPHQARGDLISVVTAGTGRRGS